MKESSIYMIYIFGLLFLLFRAIEKLKWFGGRKDEDFPIKDGTFWLYLWFSLLFIYYLIPQINFLIYISQTDPIMLQVYSNQFFGITLLFALIFIMLIKGFINPTLNFLIALTINITITIMVWQFSVYSYSLILSPLYGMLIGIIAHQILKKKYERGNRVLWEIPKVWKIINNRWFLLSFTILFAVEMYFQIHHLSITTFWLYL